MQAQNDNDNKPVLESSRQALIHALGEDHYKRAIAYLLTGNSPEDLAAMYLELMLCPIDGKLTHQEEWKSFIEVLSFTEREIIADYDDTYVRIYERYSPEDHHRIIWGQSTI